MNLRVMTRGKNRMALIGYCLMALSIPVALMAQVGAQVGPGEEGAADRPLYQVATGAELPLHAQVETFFSVGYDALRLGEDSFYWTILRPLGLEAGTREAKAVEEAVVRAQAVTSESVDLSSHFKDPARLEVARVAFWRTRASRIATIYKTMLLQLNSAGLPPETVATFIEEKMAPNTTITSTDPNALEDDVFKAAREAFEKVLAESDVTAVLVHKN